MSSQPKRGSRLPYMPFNRHEMRGDEAVAALNYHEFGVHVEAMCAAWEHRTLPADEESLRRLLKIGADEFAQVWPMVRRAWREENGRLRNAYVDKERKRVDAYYAEQARKSRIANKVRWHPRGDPPGSVRGSPRVSPEDPRGCPTYPDTDTDTVPVPPVLVRTDPDRAAARSVPAPEPERKPAKAQAERPEGVDPDLWRAFLANRKAKQKPLTPQAWTLIANRITAAGITVSAAITEAVDHGWADWRTEWNGNGRSNGHHSNKGPAYDLRNPDPNRFKGQPTIQEW